MKPRPSPQIKAAFLALSDPNDWTGDSQPEGWKMIDRAFTKAEARYIPNGPDSTADMAHPTRTGDLVVFAYPPYQFDADTPGTLVARSAFFGQHGYVPDVQNLDANVNMRATFIAGGDAIRPERGRERPAHDRPCADASPTCWAFPSRSSRRAWCGSICSAEASRARWCRVIGLTDFHGQLEPTTMTMDGRNVSVGGAAQLATMFDEEAAQLPGTSFLFASGDNVGASPANSGLLQDKPAIDVENAWGLQATSYGNHEFDYGVDAAAAAPGACHFPFLGANIVDERHGQNPDWVQGHACLRLRQPADRRDRHRAGEHARARQRGRHGRLEVPARDRHDQERSPRSCASRAQDPDRPDPRGHRPWLERGRRQLRRSRGKARS